mgnify:CR=1 FL=1
MDALTSYIYGMSMMFFSMMAWMFWRKGNDLLHRMVMWLMIVVDLQFVKDIAFFNFFDLNNEHIWYLTTALDMMIIPFYSFVLLELVKPGWFRWIKPSCWSCHSCCCLSSICSPIVSFGSICWWCGERLMAPSPSLCSLS